MSKRQAKPYAAQVAKMSKKKLAEEIGLLISISSKEDTTERLAICEAEDTKRGAGAYAAGVVLFNQSIGLRTVAPGVFDMRDIG